MAVDGGYILSVVVGTFNRRDRLIECIDSIFRDVAIPIKVFITDAGSTDGTVEYLKEINSESIDITLHEKKLGQAIAYNEIFAKVRTPYVCWLSDDNVIIDHGLKKAVHILDGNPRIGMVGLKVKDLQGPFVGEPYIGGISETGILNVNQGVLRTELLHRLGGFSEEFMDYGIDPDLTARMLYSGHDIVYTKDIAILHWRDWGEAEALHSQMVKQEKYKKLYREKYSNISPIGYPNSPWFHALSRIIRLYSKVIRLFGSNKMGFLARDYYNIMAARYISKFDQVSSKGKEFHLLQRCDCETVKFYASRLQRVGK